MNEVWLDDDDRFRHCYIAGKSGYGKTNLMLGSAVQDCLNGAGIICLDPKEEFAPDLLNAIPESRVQDTIYLDGTQNIPLDFMGWTTAGEQELLFDDLYLLFQRFFKDSGDRMDAVLRFTILTILEGRGTFLDIYWILASKSYREQFLKRIKNPMLCQFWNEQYETQQNRMAAEAIVSRMSEFLLREPIRVAMGHPYPKLRILDVVNGNKILIVNLKAIGDKAAQIYGSLIISQLKQVIFRRKKEHRRPFFLYADEFQNFRNNSFSKLLSEARSFKLGMTLANQHPHQVSELLDDIKGGVSTFVLFRMAADHVRTFGFIKSTTLKGFPVKPEDFEELPIGRALYKPPQGKPFFITTELFEPPEQSYAEVIRNRTVELYACQPTEPEVPLAYNVPDEVHPVPRPNQPPKGNKRPR